MDTVCYTIPYLLAIYTHVGSQVQKVMSLNPSQETPFSFLVFFVDIFTHIDPSFPDLNSGIGFIHTATCTSTILHSHIPIHSSASTLSHSHGGPSTSTIPASSVSFQW